ncbi:MAG: hypothetical protein AAB458_02990 [Patescibacteria group bacterium]
MLREWVKGLKFLEALTAACLAVALYMFGTNASMAPFPYIVVIFVSTSLTIILDLVRVRFKMHLATLEEKWEKQFDSFSFLMNATAHVLKGHEQKLLIYTWARRPLDERVTFKELLTAHADSGEVLVMLIALVRGLQLRGVLDRNGAGRFGVREGLVMLAKAKAPLNEFPTGRLTSAFFKTEYA